MDMFGYILFSFLDSCPDFILFRHKRPRVGSRRGTAQGAALLTKWGETAIIKAERALLLAVGSTRFAQIDYADRLAPPRRSARFYGQVYNPPASVPGLGRCRGCSALDKVLENCYHKNRKSAVTSGWLY